MKLATPSFRGMAPRITPRALPDNASQQAINARLATGDLEAYKRLELVTQLANAGVVQSIFLFDDVWLSYEEQVEFAKGAVLGDAEEARVYITGLDAPRFTTYALATGTGAPPYPGETRLLGVPAPDSMPTVAVDVAAPATSNISLTNADAEAGNTSGWTITSGGLVALDNTDVPGLVAQTGSFFFGGGTAAATAAYQAINLTSLGVIAGQGLELTWWQATGAAGSLAGMSIEFYDVGSVLISTATADQIAPTPSLTWSQRTLTTQVPSGAVTARLVQNYTLVGGGPDIDAYIDTIAINSVAYTNSFDGSTLSGWSVSPNQGPTSADKHRFVLIDNTAGWPPPCIWMRADERVPWFHRDFSTDKSPSVTLQFEYSIDTGRAGLNVLLYASSLGAGTAIEFHPIDGIRIYTHPSWDGIGGAVENLAGGFPRVGHYSISITATALSSSAARITATLTDAVTSIPIYQDLTATIPIDGPRIGFKMRPSDLHDIFKFDNINVTVAAPDAEQSATPVYTSYVYTFVNEYGEESAPSDASDTVQRNANASATITTPTTVPTGISLEYGITSKRIYRAVTGALGSEFLFVAEIPLSQADYIDILTDSQLGEVLESTDWDLPPTDLRYILSLPNGIMVGASGNRLCFSVQNRPHAWPVAYRLATDSPITGLGNVDTSVVIGTQTFVYTASGNAPDSYSMSKPGAPHSCASARSIAYLLGTGVVFSGPDGIMAVNGPTDVRNLTEMIFTREQWQALEPTSILGIAHDDIYFFFATAGGGGGSVPVTVLFQSFAGIGNTKVTSTTPTTAPDGFAWQIGGGFQDADVRLTEGAAGVFTFAGTAQNFSTITAFARGTTMTMRMLATVYPTEGGQAGYVLFYIENTAGDTYAQIQINPEGADPTRIEVIVTAETPLDIQQTVIAGPLNTDGNSVDVILTITDAGIAISGDVSGSLVIDLSAWTDVAYIEIDATDGTTKNMGINELELANATSPGTNYAYALDTKPSGFGLIELGMHAIAVGSDLEQDALMLVPDAYEEPTGTLPPADTGYTVDTNGKTIYQWNAATDPMRYSYRGKLYLLPHPMALHWARVRAFDFDDLTIQFYADGVLLLERVVTSNRPFRLPVRSEYEELDWIVIGTSRVRGVELADDIAEID